MRYLVVAIICLFSFSVLGQNPLSDSLHSHNNINYNWESHRSSTTFKYIGRAISTLGAFSYFQNAKNGAGQDKLNTSAVIILSGGVIGLLADISQDIEEVRLGKIVTEHVTQKGAKEMNSSIITINYEDSYDSSIKNKEVVFSGPLRINIDRELIYTDKKENEYIGNLLFYNKDSNCYVIEFVKNGRQKTVSIYENRHHRLSQEE
jgi:hypothetical protein